MATAAALGALGPDAAGVGRYLLVASVPAAGRSRPHLALFTDPDEAKAAFRAVRLQTDPRADWAHLVSIDAGGTLRPMRWFGTPSPSVDGAGGALATGGAGVTGVKPAGRRRRTWPRRTPVVVSLSALRAERAVHPSSAR